MDKTTYFTIINYPKTLDTQLAAILNYKPNTLKCINSKYEIIGWSEREI